MQRRFSFVQRSWKESTESEVEKMIEILEMHDATPEERKELEEQARKFEEKFKKKTPYERTKAKVYATGNKWAIENFNATH